MVWHNTKNLMKKDGTKRFYIVEWLAACDCDYCKLCYQKESTFTGSNQQTSDVSTN